MWNENLLGYEKDKDISTKNYYNMERTIARKWNNDVGWHIIKLNGCLENEFRNTEFYTRFAL